MRDPIVDDVDFEPIDALLEEVVRGAAAAGDRRADRTAARGRNRWRAAAAVLLGTGVVAGVWWLRVAPTERAAAPPAPAPAPETPSPQDPQRTQEPKANGLLSLDELQEALAGVRSVQGRARHITEWVPATDTVTMASDPDETAALGDAEIAAFREGLAQSAHTFFDDGQDGRTLRPLRRAPVLEVIVSAGAQSFTFWVALQNGRVVCFFGDRVQPVEATQPLADQLSRLYQEALRNGRRARGEAGSVDELRALPAQVRSVTCPPLDAEQVRSELSRFPQLERLTFRAGGITQAPTADVVAALPRTLRELTIQGTSLTAADVRNLAELPLLAALTLEDGSSPDAIAALAAFGPRLQRLVLPWRSIDAGPVRVRLDEPNQVAIHYPNDLAQPAATWRSLRDAVAGGLSLTELAIEGDRGMLDGAEVLASATSLRALRLSLRGAVRAVDIDWLPAVASLRELSLRDCKVDDDAVPVLGKLTQLRALDLTNTAFTADGVASLRRQLPECTITARPGVVVSPPGTVTVRKG